MRCCTTLCWAYRWALTGPSPVRRVSATLVCATLVSLMCMYTYHEPTCVTLHSRCRCLACFLSRWRPENHVNRNAAKPFIPSGQIQYIILESIPTEAVGVPALHASMCSYTYEPTYDCIPTCHQYAWRLQRRAALRARQAAVQAAVRGITSTILSRPTPAADDPRMWACLARLAAEEGACSATAFACLVAGGGWVTGCCEEKAAGCMFWCADRRCSPQFHL